MRLVAQEGHRLPELTTVAVPDGIDEAKVRTALLKLFNIEVAAKDEADAAHTVISTIGSRHSVTRKYVTVKEIVPLKADEITDPVVKRLVGGAQ